MEREKNLNKMDFLEALKEQKQYFLPLESGTYLGFYVPGEFVLLSHVKSQQQEKQNENAFACPVSGLFS